MLLTGHRCHRSVEMAWHFFILLRYFNDQHRGPQRKHEAWIGPTHVLMPLPSDANVMPRRAVVASSGAAEAPPVVSSTSTCGAAAAAAGTGSARPPANPPAMRAALGLMAAAAALIVSVHLLLEATYVQRACRVTKT